MDSLTQIRANLPIILHRLLRRGSVERGVKALRIAMIVLMFLFIILVMSDLLEHTLSGRTATARLAEQVNQILASNTESSLTPAPKDKDYSIIVKRNIFGDLGSDKPATPAPTPPPAKPSTLALIGVFFSPDGISESIIEDTKKSSQEIFRIGDTVFEDGTLKRILPDRVEIERNGKIEVLIIDESLTAVSGGDGGEVAGDAEEVAVDEVELNTALENIPLLLTQARAVPYFKDGQSIGLRLFAIKSGSLYEKVGLKNGDILKTINGNSLGDISQAMKLFETLKVERSLSLTLERNRQTKVYRYNIR